MSKAQWETCAALMAREFFMELYGMRNVLTGAEGYLLFNREMGATFVSKNSGELSSTREEIENFLKDMSENFHKPETADEWLNAAQELEHKVTEAHGRQVRLLKGRTPN